MLFELPFLGKEEKEAQIAQIKKKQKKKIYMNPFTEGTFDGRSLYLCYLSFLFRGSFGSAVGRDAVHRSAGRRRRIRTGSNPTP